ncbi:MAG: hypothetical protein US94_C0031G0007 [Berkelbacteria bacterium GW2011_GWB1_38_5]|uniref:PPC domain-containing protein n=1 Tax=Berkelbacteria bacterium GW2011_GWB1_38_5 TaxID=1618336 RepID=A0A0G0KDQ4_9BACT|nr:MAG: hypothetical protein US94_C0031G0007 [Berkelbacteria bacterium GW2011_GWB1_38_5]
MKLTNIYVFRVKPDQELSEAILKYCQAKKISSAIVFSIIGSAKNVELGFLKKLPGKFIKKKFQGPLEIVNGSGTIAQKGDQTLLHAHIQISSEKKSIGGHLISAKIFSTAEVVIGEVDQAIKRVNDKYTGLNELKIE